MENTYSFKEASKKLDYFIKEKVRSYAKMRNFDFGSPENNFVSGLSPAISRRILTEKYVVKKVLEFFPFYDVEKFIQEICWRTYWKGFLEHRPSIWKNYLHDLNSLQSQKEHQNYKEAVSGCTGIDCFNSWSKELQNKNYLHNHTRMWFASIWIHTLSLPWQLGAELFMEKLYDADPASNTLSWRWVAGIHTQNKNYIASAENIKKFTGGAFYPKKQLNKNAKTFTWENFEPENFNFQDYQKPKNVDCILIHENNLSLQDIPDFKYMLIQQNSLQSISRSKKVCRYIDKALEDFKKRVTEKFTGKIIPFTFENFQPIQNFVYEKKISEIYSPYPSIGLLKSKLMDIEKLGNIKFIFFCNSWDSLFWPHAKKGFFKLKKQIKPIITNLDQIKLNL